MYKEKILAIFDMLYSKECAFYIAIYFIIFNIKVTLWLYSYIYNFL